tara:strand:- start:208 stop:459 length:252 start_codon:yes stop_codon:yes gene_type:complete
MRDQIIASITEHLKNEGVQTEIAEDTRFDDMNIDSLGLYSMIAGVEDQYDIIVPCADFTCATNVGELADKIADRMPGQMARAA